MDGANPLREKFDSTKAAVDLHFTSGDPILRPRRMFKVLDSVRDVEWDLEWQETMILACCLCQRRAASTHGSLLMLRTARETRNELPIFEEFMEKITKILYPKFITPHGYTRTFSQMDAVSIFNSMGKAVAPLSALNKPIFLYAGALLGYVRSGAMIGHDDDVDVGIYLGECTAIEAAEKWFEYKQAINLLGLIDADERASNRPVFKLQSDLQIDIDLFPAWIEKDRFSVYPYSSSHMAKEDILPMVHFSQDPIMMVANTKALLEQSYGESWRVPDPLFHLDWKRKNKGFKPLLAKNYVIEEQSQKESLLNS